MTHQGAGVPGTILVCSWSHGTVTALLPPAPTVHGCWTQKGCRAFRERGCRHRGCVGGTAGGMWGSGVESPGWEAPVHTAAPVLCRAMLAILQDGVPMGDYSRLWLLQLGAGCYWSLVWGPGCCSVPHSAQDRPPQRITWPQRPTVPREGSPDLSPTSRKML